MCSSSKHSAIDNAHVTDSNTIISLHAKLSANTIIKVCTLLDLVNRVASREWIKLRAAIISNDELEYIARVGIMIRMRQSVEKMDESNLAFARTHRSSKSGLETHIFCGGGEDGETAQSSRVSPHLRRISPYPDYLSSSICMKSSAPAITVDACWRTGDLGNNVGQAES